MSGQVAEGTHSREDEGAYGTALLRAAPLAAALRAVQAALLPLLPPPAAALLLAGRTCHRIVSDVGVAAVCLVVHDDVHNIPWQRAQVGEGGFVRHNDECRIHMPLHRRRCDSRRPCRTPTMVDVGSLRRAGTDALQAGCAQHARRHCVARTITGFLNLFACRSVAGWMIVLCSDAPWRRRAQRLALGRIFDLAKQQMRPYPFGWIRASCRWSEIKRRVRASATEVEISIGVGGVFRHLRRTMTRRWCPRHAALWRSRFERRRCAAHGLA